MVRYTESEIVKIVKQVINEQKVITAETKKQISQMVVNEGKKVSEYFKTFYSKPETIKKFKNKNNPSVVVKYIPTIKFKMYSKNDYKNGYVKNDNSGIIYLNVSMLFTIDANGNAKLKPTTSLYDTILHEMGHLIDFKMRKLGEKTIPRTEGYYDVEGDQDEYVNSDIETFARIQRLREELGLGAISGGTAIKQKLFEFYKAKKWLFPDIKVFSVKQPVGLLFKYKNTTKGELTDLWQFYSKMTMNGTSVPDIAALFAKYSMITKEGSVFLNLEAIGKVNVQTKFAPTN